MKALLYLKALSLRVLILMCVTLVVLGIMYSSGATPMGFEKNNYLSWWQHYPAHVFFSVVILFGVLAGFSALFRSFRWYVTWIAALTVAFAYTNSLKIEKTQVPLLIHDFGFIRYSLLLVQYLSPWMFVGIFALVIVSYYLRRLRARPRDRRVLPLYSEAAAFFCMAVLLSCYVVFTPINQFKFILQKDPAHELGYWNQLYSFQRNGPLLSMLYNLRAFDFPPPADYSQETVRAQLQPLESSYQVPVQKEKPNIVIIMVESMMDPMDLQGVQFSRDPIPFLRGLMKQSPTRKVVVPTFGGGTANAEFELLTGLPVSVLPTASIAYEHYIHGPVPSLVELFKENGYRSFALHNYVSKFWRRKTVYPFLGFDQFLSLEDLLNGEKRTDWRPSDRLLTEKMKELLISAKQDQPVFIFAVTMRTHGPYTSEVKGADPIKVEGRLNEREKRELENYVNALNETDAAFKDLINSAKATKRETQFLIFGDHFPALASGVSFFYDHLPQEKNESLFDRDIKVRRTPLIYWSTAGLRVDVPEVLELGCVSSLFLSPLNLETDPFWMWQSDLCRTNSYFINVNSEKGAENQERLKLFFYDRILGRQYSH